MRKMREEEKGGEVDEGIREERKALQERGEEGRKEGWKRKWRKKMRKGQKKSELMK